MHFVRSVRALLPLAGAVLLLTAATQPAAAGLEEAVKALQAQTAAIEALQVGQTAILAEASKPIVLDAELKATLAEVPVQCRVDLGGDVASVQCQWATCLQFGQSSAQRPECRQIEQLMVDTLKVQGTKTE